MTYRTPVLALLFVLCSCGSDLDTGDNVYTLPSGVVVNVAASGAFTLSAGERVVFATAEGASITAHLYEPFVAEFSGFYRFERVEEDVRALDRFSGSEATDDGVALHFRGASVRTTVLIHGGDADDESTRITITTRGPERMRAVSVPVRCDEAASFLGFGEQYELTDQRGEIFDLWVREQGIGRTGGSFPTGDRHDTYFPMPYTLDARGFGLAIDTYARVVVDLCSTDPNVASFGVESTEPLELVVLHGPTPADVVRELGDVFGRPTAPEDWAWGPWMAIQGGQQTVLDEADALDAAMVPYTALWAQDWVGREFITGAITDIEYHWNVGLVDYPDLAALTANLHGRGKRFLGYFNPFVLTNFEHFQPMADADLLMRSADGEPLVETFFKGRTSLPDLTMQASRDYVAGFMNTAMQTHGMDGWMADFAESVPTRAQFANGEDGMAIHNRYPLLWQGLNNDTARATLGNDYAIFSRSGWLGSQGTTQFVWLGDQESDDSNRDGLPTVVPAMINLGISGIPFVTHDIAGYSGGPSTKPLFMRWTELGAFTPVMRTHEGLLALANWQWNSDAETLDHFRRFARIHEALVPELAALADTAAQTSMPIVRHMVLMFPNDPNVVGLDQQYMFGDTLLVAPIIKQDDVAREVYLPAGTWYHVFTGDMYVGPMTLMVDAPIGTPPVFSLGVDRADLRAIN